MIWSRGSRKERMQGKPLPTDQAAPPQKIKFNQNSPAFEDSMGRLYKRNIDKFNQLKKMLDAAKAKLEERTWAQLYQQSTKNPKKKTGLNWEKLDGETTADGRQLYSLRLSRKARLLAFREGNELVAYDYDLDH